MSKVTPKPSLMTPPQKLRRDPFDGSDPYMDMERMLDKNIDDAKKRDKQNGKTGKFQDTSEIAGAVRRLVLPKNVNEKIKTAKKTVKKPLKAARDVALVGAAVAPAIGAGLKAAGAIGAAAKAGKFASWLAKAGRTIGSIVRWITVLDTHTGDVVKRRLKVVDKPGHEFHLHPHNPRYRLVSASTDV